MEKLVRVMGQGALKENEWTNDRGETRTIKSLEVTLTDGNDTFVGEMKGDQAEQTAKNPLRQDVMYSVRCKLEVNKATNKSTGATREFNSIRILDIKPF